MAAFAPDKAPCRIVVLISGSGSNLQALLDAAADTEHDFEVVAAISNKAGVQGLQRAQAAGVDAVVIDHRHFPSREDFDQTLADSIEGYRPDLVLLAGFMRILTSAFVNRFRGRLINIHPSLLPRYTGLNTHQRALDAGDNEAGCSVHFVTEQLDGGPVIAQARVPVRPGDDAAKLTARVLREEHRIYPLVARWFAQGRLRLVDQQAHMDDQPLPPEGHLGAASAARAST